MGQFTVHRNPNPATAKAVPYLLDVQSELLSDLQTRVGVPLCPLPSLVGKPVSRLMPVFTISGEPCAMLTPQLAGVAKSALGAPVADLTSKRDDIVAALDFLVTGV